MYQVAEWRMPRILVRLGKIIEKRSATNNSSRWSRCNEGGSTGRPERQLETVTHTPVVNHAKMTSFFYVGIYILFIQRE